MVTSVGIMNCNTKESLTSIKNEGSANSLVNFNTLFMKITKYESKTKSIKVY